MLTRKSEGTPSRARLARRAGTPATMDRRKFLKRSGLVAGAGAIATQLPYGSMGSAEVAAQSGAAKQTVARTVCTHCSVARNRCSTRR